VSKKKDTMTYEDFIWFMLSEEDKSSNRGIEYWFSVVDLDGNGIIGPHEMNYFYDEQVKRLESLNREPILFIDILCQLNDAYTPEKEGNFTLADIKRKREFASVFFNSLLNLNKFIDFEQRDVFAVKHEIAENPGFSDWDRFATNEYMRLAYEEENREDVFFYLYFPKSDVFDANDPWEDNEEQDGGEGKKKGETTEKTSMPNAQ